MAEEKIMLVVSITSGRNFPQYKDRQLIVEGRFNDEKLYSDPVAHLPTPQINTELAWELDRKAVHHHKIQRTPIKLNVFAGNLSSDKNELIGYIVLDLRGASSTTSQAKWMPLLSSKYSKFKPELSVVLTLEEEPSAGANNVLQENNSGKLPVETKEENGKPFLQIGKGGSMYVFSLSLLSGERLVNLMPANRPVHEGFYWFYQLRGNDVVHEPFTELTAPFPVERASLNLQGLKKNLCRFLTAELCPIEIHLCSGEQSLGHAMVQFGQPLTKAFKELDLTKDVARSKITVPMKPNPSMGGIKGASLVVELSIRAENVPQTPLNSTSEQLAQPVPRGLPKPLAPELSEGQNNTDHEIAEIDYSEPTTTSSHLVAPQVQVHYSFSIEIQTLRMKEYHQISVYVKYSYPFFGSSKPIFSGAPVPLHMKNQQVKLTEPFCQFDFACAPRQLENQFRSVPLVLEVWTRSQNEADRAIGTVVIPIEKLLPANMKPKIANENLAVALDNRVVGDIDVKFWLENKGPIKQQIIIPPNEASNKEEELKRMQEQMNMSMDRKREDLEKLQFKTALDLQLWKDEQEEEFTKYLKQREDEMIKKIAGEFTRREQERDQVMSTRVSQYEKMEKQLRKALAEAKKAETRVSDQEKELARLRDDLQAEKDRIRQDAKTAFEQQKLERAKTAAAEERASKYRLELDETDHKYKSLLDELEISKRQAPDPHLQAEVKSLLVEKNELEKRIDSLSKAKQHYKLQWSRAIKEVATMKEREIESAEVKLRRKQEEMEEMRARYQAAQDHQEMIAERDTIRAMKNEFKNTQKSFSNFHGQQFESEDTGYRKLLDDKEQLLKSGAYTEQDQVIQEINRKLREMSCSG
ncbi:Oidioi.mRNA.OKI2018_I69.PAR.g11177.t1.cds [Oikopleura dioica]|uniref:Oidioi.mRNA.OKI2018_I69.PAR.g11177.t1.cds n=1 Tax=Oikopleura dioica TaxID=34765 RepID=A0ABN7RZB6_OIKDI|nr:Oidioi.mRNA.OKI2018_I69.PAR.g11177.t1.cds [Oikopleura dioica]